MAAERSHKDPQMGHSQDGSWEWGGALSRRAALRLAGVCAGGAAALGLGLARSAAAGDASQANGLLFEYLSDRAKFKSPEFMLANRLADSLLVFGSSELATSRVDIPQVPRATFGDHDHGLDMWCVGEGYNQSLWHAIAIGAYVRACDAAARPAGRVAPNVFDAAGSRKAVLVISPQWFFEGGVPPAATRAQFGYGLWQGLCANGDVADSDKDYLAGRLRDMGVDAGLVDAGLRRGPAQALDGVVLGAQQDYLLRRDLGATRTRGDAMPAAKEQLSCAEGVPDWDALNREATAQASASSTTNAYGMLDSWWTAHNQADYEAGKLEGFLRNRTLLNAPTEDADLACCLRVAAACGVDLLCVLLPFPGDWADYEQLDRSDRQRRYELVREAVQAGGAHLADLSGEEYTRYFIGDGTHLGWLGWLAAERAIYEFAMGE